jgi:hypothetical protein
MSGPTPELIEALAPMTPDDVFAQAETLAIEAIDNLEKAHAALGVVVALAKFDRGNLRDLVEACGGFNRHYDRAMSAFGTCMLLTNCEGTA